MRRRDVPRYSIKVLDEGLNRGAGWTEGVLPLIRHAFGCCGTEAATSQRLIQHFGRVVVSKRQHRISTSRSSVGFPLSAKAGSWRSKLGGEQAALIRHAVCRLRVIESLSWDLDQAEVRSASCLPLYVLSASLACTLFVFLVKRWSAARYTTNALRMAAKAPVSPEKRKKVLKVLFISLLLDLVRTSKHECSPHVR